ncbi:sigma 54-interacting transcriptional regulator [Pantoea sp. B65]|uniref:sigma 54-interacting transcriptional regulator n=1 Tax=Pantoea sp. B65 TaxID=2813359 RepID=UPI0039B60F68
MARDKPAWSEHDVNQIVAHSPAMKQVMANTARLAPATSPVLLRGEPGSGKEGIARAIHAQSAHAAGPFIKWSCDYAASEQTLLALLQQHRDATCASHQRHGTLFLSEIGHFTLPMQKCLLHLVQEEQYRSLDGSSLLPCSLRIVCATEKNLEQRVAAESFLPELYYRLHVATIILPSLQERREDIPQLVANFFTRFNRSNNLSLSISNAALAPLATCQWPANVRDLENCLEYAVLNRQKDEIDRLPCQADQCLRQQLNFKVSHYSRQANPPAASLPQVFLPISTTSNGYDRHDEIRHRFISALEKSGWVKAKAARLLNITPRQLYYALEKLQIEVKKF